MKINIVLALLLCQFNIYTSAQQYKKFFRKDYRYFESTRTFYKIHTVPQTWDDAKKTCELEGSTFFYPNSKAEAEVIAGYMMNISSSRAFISASAKLVRGIYETTNGIPVVNLYVNWARDEPNGGHPQDCAALHRDGTMYDEDCVSKLPFICKKTLSSLEWDPLCNMPNFGYKYNEATGRCYKFHKDQLNWLNAYAACNAELSYLAVVDNQDEANTLVNISKTSPKNSPVTGEFSCYYQIHLGFHDRNVEGWVTIKGVPLAESGYSTWLEGEPNGGKARMEIEKCGTMFYTSHGLLNDIGCQHRCPFICEHEVHLTADIVQEDTTENEWSTQQDSSLEFGVQKTL